MCNTIKECEQRLYELRMDENEVANHYYDDPPPPIPPQVTKKTSYEIGQCQDLESLIVEGFWGASLTSVQVDEIVKLYCSTQEWAICAPYYVGIRHRAKERLGVIK